MGKIKAEIAGKILTLLGYDGTDFQNLLVDAAGHLQVDVLSGGGAPGGATEAKQDVLLGKVKDQLFTYKGQLIGAAQDTNPDAGTVVLRVGPVPANEVWVVTFASLIDMDNIPEYGYIAVTDLVNYYRIIMKQLPPIAETIHVEMTAILVEDDYMHGQLAGVTAGDDCYFAIFGYKMSV